MSSSQATILVTGATGFVGSHLVDHLLERGRRVKCLVRRTSRLKYLEHSQLDFVYGGLDDQTDWDDAFDGVDTIYHVAGVTFARRPQDYFDVNQKGTEAILAGAIKHRSHLKKFVLVSSLAAVGPARDGKPVDEETQPAPLTPYGRSKLMGEEAVHAVGDLLPSTIVRPPAVYGPRDYGVFEFFKMINGGIFPMIGSYEKRVSLVHASDLADGIILAGESTASTGRTYFISSKEVYPMKDVAGLIAKILGKHPRKLTIPKPIAYAAGLAGEAISALTRKPPVINRDKVTDLSQTCWGCSIERATSELGYREQVPLEDGLRETVAWYKREGWL
ncbi:MAG TPA: NAD-dependent epimerase/dehydratase family protein [Blastocatellia bacterium]|nr:NAD-dependent epimerase/dehydratase family protein [Blastocatellia bacterium]